MLSDFGQVIGVDVVKIPRSYQLRHCVPQHQHSVAVDVDDVAFFAYSHVKREINVVHSDRQIEESEISRQFPEEDDTGLVLLEGGTGRRLEFYPARLQRTQKRGTWGERLVAILPAAEVREAHKWQVLWDAARFSSVYLEVDLEGSRRVGQHLPFGLEVGWFGTAWIEQVQDDLLLRFGDVVKDVLADQPSLHVSQ